MSKRKHARFENTKVILRTLGGLIEVSILTLLYYITWRVGYKTGVFPQYLGGGKYVLMGVYVLLTILLLQQFDCFKFGQLRRLDIAISQCVALLFVDAITYLQLCLIANRMVSLIPILILYVVGIGISILVILVCARLYDYWYVPYNMVMIYGTDKSVGMKLKTDERRDRYRVNKLIHYKSGYQQICQQIVAYDAVLINDVPAQNRNDILKFCYENHIRAYVVPKVSDIIVRGAKPVNMFDTPLMVVEGCGLNLFQKFWKRAMDIVLCTLSMVVAAPIMLVVAIAIKLDDGGPVFYKQARVTLNGRVFDILKFRSMIVDAEKDGHSIPATDGDPRITRVGRVIRATRIDELPQILNILKGDMSIVGPRPERVEHMDKYTSEIPEFKDRLKVKGGLTGYAQIFGKYNTTAYDKLRLDMMYIENYSLLLDIKLIALTLRVMLQKESTEGFDKAAENEKRLEELLHEMRAEDERYQDDLMSDRR